MEMIHMDVDMQGQVDKILAFYSWELSPTEDIKEATLVFLQKVQKEVKAGNMSLHIAELGFKRIK